MHRRLFDPNLVSGLTPRAEYERRRMVAEHGRAGADRIIRQARIQAWREQVAQAERALERCTTDEDRARCRRNLDWAREQLDQINGRHAMAAE